MQLEMRGPTPPAVNGPGPKERRARRRAWALLLALTFCPCAGGCAVPTPGRYVAVYAGTNTSQNHDLYAREYVRDSGATTQVEFRSPVRDSLTFGARTGMWVSSLPWWGLALDASMFEPEGGAVVDADVVTVTPLLIARLPLFPADRSKQGRVTPYVGVGPCLFLTDAQADVRPTISRRISESPFDVELGVDARAGLGIELFEGLQIFAEFRYTHFRGNFDEQEGGNALSDPRAERRFRQTFITRHFLFGLTFSF